MKCATWVLKTTANLSDGRSFFAKMGTESEKSYQKVRLIQIKAVFLYPKEVYQRTGRIRAGDGC